MTPRTLLSTILSSSMIAVALFSGANPTAAPRALAETTTTITFDDLPAGTTVTNQYDAQGVDFEKGIIDNGVYCDPVITQVGSQDAQSGDQVADTSCADGEFPDSSIWGVLKNDAENLSVYVGFFPNWANPPATVGVTLTAYDADGNVVTSDTETVPTGQGAHTPLQLSSSSPNIAQFSVANASAAGSCLCPNIYIDNLTFDNPAGVPPDFRLHSETFGGVTVQQGFSTDDVIDINRLNGSSGDITFGTSGLPSGVDASFNPNPADGASTTMTVSANSNAPLTSGSAPSITVTGTPSSTAGSTPQSLSLAVDVLPNFTVEGPQNTVQVPPCSQVQVPVSITWTYSKPPKFSGDVTLGVNGLSSDDSASFNPSTVSFDPGTYSAKSTMTLTSHNDLSAPPANVTVTGTSGLFSYSSGAFTVARVGPSIDSLTNSEGAAISGGQTPQGTHTGEGDIVIVRGHGFCPGTTVYYGNALAAAVTQGPTADGSLRTYVPRLATTGKVYAVPPGASFNAPGTAVSSRAFNVDNYRNTNGFSFVNSDTFQNSVGGYSFGDVSDVFGDAQTHISVNPCWPFGDCSIVTSIPDPFALLFWGIADATLQGGQCFGFSLASQRLLNGDEPYSNYPLQSAATDDSVWNLQGPEDAGGPSGSLAHFIHLMHLEQYSAEALHWWLGSAEYNAIVGSQSSIAGQIDNALQNGDHPLLELRNGSEGHVVVAYDIEDSSNGNQQQNGDDLINVYDPNQPFTTSEDQDTSGLSHQGVLQSSQIVLRPDGHWVFQGAFDDSPWHGGPGSLVVVPYGIVPVHPTIPTSLSGLVDLLFGSARVSQVTDVAGHTLLDPRGAIDTSPKTGIPDATQFATLSGSSKAGPRIFLFGKPGAYTQTIRDGSGSMYHDSLFGRGLAASLTARGSAGATDKVSVTSNGAGMQFGQMRPGNSSAVRPVSAQLLVHVGDGSERTAAIGTSMATTGTDTVGFDSARNSITVKAGGKALTYSATLSTSGPHGYPQEFAAPSETIQPGESATLTPKSWSSLESSVATLKLVTKDGEASSHVVKNQVRPADRYSVSLSVTKARRGRRKLTIETTVKRVVIGSTALLTWQVFAGSKLIAGHNRPLPAAKVHRGLLKSSYVLSSVTPGKVYILRATVALFGPSSTGTVGTQRLTESKSFRG